VLRAGEPRDEQAEGGERRGAAGAHAGQGGQHLPGAVGQQGGDLVVHGGDVGGQGAPAGQSGGPGRGVGRRGQAGPPPVDPKLGLAIEDPAAARARSERSEGGRPAKAAVQPSTAWPMTLSTGSARPCPFGAARPGQSVCS
jgi:hypothetical protein